MHCPCCQAPLKQIYSHTKLKDDITDGRTYDVYLCVEGGQWCNGMLVKHDVFDQKITYTTPAHTTTTLHRNYVESVSHEDLLKTIFSTFEYLAHVATVPRELRGDLLKLD